METGERAGTRAGKKEVLLQGPPLEQRKEEVAPTLDNKKVLLKRDRRV